MPDPGYLIAFTDLSPKTAASMVALFNIAGVGKMFFGAGHRSVWFVRKGKRKKEEMLAMLAEVSSIHDPEILPVSTPPLSSDIPAIRKIFLGLEWDTRNIPDAALLAYLDSLISGKCEYYIDFRDMHSPGSPVLVHLVPIQEHPDYSPDWLTQVEAEEEELPDREYTLADFEIVEDSFEDIVRDDTRVEPPRPSTGSRTEEPGTDNTDTAEAP